MDNGITLSWFSYAIIGALKAWFLRPSVEKMDTFSLGCMFRMFSTFIRRKVYQIL